MRCHRHDWCYRLPQSPADTAYRSARLTLADWFKIDQKPIKNRLALTVPLLAVGAVLTQVDVQVVWRYFSWSNQTLAMIALWAASISVPRKRFYWLTAPSGHLHVGCILYLYPDGKGRLPALHRHRLSCRHHLCSSSVLGTFVFHLRDGQGKRTQTVTAVERTLWGLRERLNRSSYKKAIKKGAAPAGLIRPWAAPLYYYILFLLCPFYIILFSACLSSSGLFLLSK